MNAFLKSFIAYVMIMLLLPFEMLGFYLFKWDKFEQTCPRQTRRITEHKNPIIYKEPFWTFAEISSIQPLIVL